MAEITASFGAKNITISYPDEIEGQAGEAFSLMLDGEWEEFLLDKPEEEAEEDAKNRFVVHCIMSYVLGTIRQSLIQQEMSGAAGAAATSADAVLDQIKLEID